MKREHRHSQTLKLSVIETQDTSNDIVQITFSGRTSRGVRTVPYAKIKVVEGSRVADAEVELTQLLFQVLRITDEQADYVTEELNHLRVSTTELRELAGTLTEIADNLNIK